MLGKRSILLSFVKDKEKSGEAPIIQPPPADVEKIISSTIEVATTAVVIGVAAYFGCSTLSQILVKLTPTH